MAFGDFVQSRSADVASNTFCTLAFTSPVTAGNLLIVAIRMGGAQSTVTISDGGQNNAWTNQHDDANADTFSNWVCLSAVAGATTIRVDHNAAGTMRIIIAEYASGGQTIALDQQAFGGPTNSTTISSGASSTRTAATELLVGLEENVGATACIAGTAPASWTLRENPASKCALEDLMVTSAGTDAATASFATTDTWIMRLLTFKATSAGGGAADLSVNLEEPTLAAWTIGP